MAALPNSRYRVQLDNGDEILAHPSGDMRMNLIRILPGDAVTVEVSPFDRNLGRITHHGKGLPTRAEP